MTIRNDAGELLKKIYDLYVSDVGQIGTQRIREEINWESGRLNRAIDYLRDLNAIKITLFLGNTEGVYNFLINGLSPYGINLAEDENQFQNEFG